MDKKLKLFLTISVMINVLLAGVVFGGVYFHNIVMDNNNMPQLSKKFKKHHKDNKEIAKTCVCAKKRLKLALTEDVFNQEKYENILKEYVDCRAKFTKKLFEKEKEFYLTLNVKEKKIYNNAEEKRKKFRKFIKCHKQ